MKTHLRCTTDRYETHRMFLHWISLWITTQFDHNIDQFGFKNVISLRPPYLGGGGGGASKSMTKDEYFKLCPALVQEQVYTWVIVSPFILLEAPPPPGMVDATFLKPKWSIEWIWTLLGKEARSSKINLGVFCSNYVNLIYNQ